jgi:flagellar biogenesis protein FliO
MIDEPILNAAITMFISVVVLALILFLVKKYTPKLRGINSVSDFKIEARLPLAPKSNLFIVTIEGKRFLIGSGESSVNLISELDSNQSINNSDDESVDDSPQERSNPTFSSFLKQSFSKKKI